MNTIKSLLSNKEYCEKIAAMTLEKFKEELSRRGIELPDPEHTYRMIKTSIASGELDEDDLAAVSGGHIIYYNNFDYDSNGC